MQLTKNFHLGISFFIVSFTCALVGALLGMHFNNAIGFICYLFFGVSGILMIICIIYSCLLYKSKYFNETLKSKQEVVTKPPVPEETELKLLDNNRNSINDNEDDPEQGEKEIPKIYTIKPIK